MKTEPMRQLATVGAVRIALARPRDVRVGVSLAPGVTQGGGLVLVPCTAAHLEHALRRHSDDTPCRASLDAGMLVLWSWGLL